MSDKDTKLTPERLAELKKIFPLVSTHTVDPNISWLRARAEGFEQDRNDWRERALGAQSRAWKWAFKWYQEHDERIVLEERLKAAEQQIAALKAELLRGQPGE